MKKSNKYQDVNKYPINRAGSGLRNQRAKINYYNRAEILTKRPKMRALKNESDKNCSIFLIIVVLLQEKIKVVLLP